MFLPFWTNGGAHFSHVPSILTDRATLNAHTLFWGYEAKPYLGDLNRLTPDEQILFEHLRHNKIQPGLRLEQEHVGFGWVLDALPHLLATQST